MSLDSHTVSNDVPAEFSDSAPAAALDAGPTTTVASRIVWFVLFAMPLAVIITAATLTPDTAGHGTHTQLGLPPCGFYVFTGLPCPGCGLTTCFAHMMRLEVTGAATANAFGVALFLVTFFTIPIAFMGMVRGWPVIATLERLQFEKVVILLALCSTVVWTIRILTLLF